MAREHDRLPAARLALIYNGVDTRLFCPDLEARAHWRKELGLGEREPVIISVGRLAPEKDYGLLLEALAATRDLGPEAKLVLVGDGAERTTLQDEAAELGLQQRVRFVGRQRDVPGLLSAADLFALSSLSEGIPMALLEAMACGLPVVALRVGGTPELVEDGRSGLLVGGRKPEDLAEAISRILTERDTARAMGVAGQRRVAERFSLESMLEGYGALYRELAG